MIHLTARNFDELPEGEEYGEYTLIRDNDRDLAFTGYMVASTSDFDHYNDVITHYFTLYRTASGKFVCEAEKITKLGGDKNTNKVKVCNTLNEVIDYFGFSELAKSLYRKAGIKLIERI